MELFEELFRRGAAFGDFGGAELVAEGGEGGVRGAAEGGRRGGEMGAVMGAHDGGRYLRSFRLVCMATGSREEC